MKEKNDLPGSLRLSLRPATDDEMRAMIDAQTDPGLRAAYGEMLNGCLAHPEARVWYAVWLMLLRAPAPDGTPAGTVLGDLCFKGLGRDGAVEIGYGIDPAYEGQGYTTEAVRALCAWASAQPGVTRIEAETDPDNRASQRVLEKCGFVPTGEVGEEGPRFVLASHRIKT